MSLEWSKITVPMAQGINESIDPRVLPPTSLAEVQNGEWDKAGAINKRRGFTKLTNLQTDGVAIPDGKTIFSTGTELCIIGKNQLYAFNALDGRWHDRGIVSPAIGRILQNYRSEISYDGGDVDTLGGYVLRAVHETKQTSHGNDPTNFKYSVSVDVVSRDDQVVLSSVSLASSAAVASKPHAVRVANTTGKLLIFFIEGTGSSTGRTLRTYEYVTATPFVAPVLVATTTSVWTNKNNARSYDVIGLASGNYLQAYIRFATKDVSLSLFSSSHLSLASAVISTNTPYERVALAESPTEAKVYVLLYSTDVAGRRVELWVLNNSTLATIAGPILLEALASTGTADGLGVVETNSRVVCCWSLVDSATPAQYDTHHIDTNTSGVSASSIQRIYNSSPQTRPWAVGTNTYLMCASSVDDYLYEFHAMFRLRTNESSSRSPPFFVGLHDVGTAVSLGNGPLFADADNADLFAYNKGAGNNVVLISTNNYRYMSTSRVFTLAKSDGEIQYQQRFAQDDVSLDFATPPLATTVQHGAAVIGGARVGWYAGATATELGFAAPPDIISATPSATGGTLAAGTYTYWAIWEDYDERGNLRRSLPSRPTALITVSGATSSVALVCRSLPTMSTSTGGAVFFRAGSDGIAKRINEPLRQIPNDTTISSISTFTDIGQVQGPPLYTESGEIESVCPEGARIVLVASERVWWADFYRRDRVQWSKRYSPGSANQHLIAPETNEGFGLSVPSGNRVTGLAAMDDKIVVFTSTEIYALSGRGPDDDGSNNDFSAFTLISNDTGCIDARSVLSYQDGVLYQTQAGIYKLSRALQVSFIGAPVEALVADRGTITSSVLVPKKNQARFTVTRSDGTTGIIVVYDYGIDQWAFWKLLDAGGVEINAISACLHDDEYHILTSGGVTWKEDSAVYKDDVTQWVPLSIETAWLQSAGQSGWQRIRKVIPLMERKDAHDLNISVYNDFYATTSQLVTFTDATQLLWTELPRSQPLIHVLRQKCQAIKVRIADSIAASSPGRGYTIAGISFEIGAKRGTVKVASRQRN